MDVNSNSADIVVIGSGPGGANTAYLLAAAGKDVLLIEEGRAIAETLPAYSLKEMNTSYRNGGMTVALGRSKVIYIEPRCVGGGSEINAGLYHPPDPEVLDEWGRRFGLPDFSARTLDPFFKSWQADVPVSFMPKVGLASQRIQRGCDALKWKSAEIQRFWKYDNSSLGGLGVRQSMAQTIIPRAIKAGCRLLTNARVKRVSFKSRQAQYLEVSDANDTAKPSRKIFFKQLFICGGAVQTPALLRRSGVKRNIGNSLRMHPALRLAAKFPDRVNDVTEGVPVVQVQEFEPRFTLGGSYSSIPHLALWMAGRDDIERRLADWSQTQLFYALAIGSAAGWVRQLPGLADPLVSLKVTPLDRQHLGAGLYELGKMLFAAGAQEVILPMAGYPVAKQLKELEELRSGEPLKNADLSTIHLFGSCPMGEDAATSAVNSYGKLHGFDNVYLNDASLMPDSPRVNPQGVIMAIARRNVAHFLNELS